MRSMIEQDVGGARFNQQTTIRDNESTVKALKMVINEQQREIDHLLASLEKVQKERDFAQGKALISEEITYAAEKSEKKLIAELEHNIFELNTTIQTQASRIQILEKQVDQKEEQTGIVVRYRDVIHPNTASILLHDEMETLHQLIVRLQLQANYLKSIQLKLVTLIHNILTTLQTKIQGELIDLDEDHERAQQEFLKILELIQLSKLPNIDIPIKQTSNQSPLNTEVIHSPIPSPFPAKAPQIKKVFANLNQTFDAGMIGGGMLNDSSDKKVVPKLNLSKAFQIQQINAKRSTQQVKMTEEQLQSRLKKLEQEMEESKKSLSREMILCKHYEIENEQMRRYIKQVEANNDILVNSNNSLMQKWQKIQKGFIFYKTFFVEHKDQFAQLQMIVQSEKEVHSNEDQVEVGFNSARVEIKKDMTRRKKQILDTSTYAPFLGEKSLMEVEKELSRVNQSQSYIQHNGRFQSESVVDQLDIDVELGDACLDREDSNSNRNQGDWKHQIKKEWTYMATQVHSAKPRELAQQIKSSQPIQKLTNIKM